MNKSIYKPMKYLYIGEEVLMKPFDLISNKNDTLTCLYIIDNILTLVEQKNKIISLMYFSGFNPVVKNNYSLEFYNQLKQTKVKYYFIGKKRNTINLNDKYDALIVGNYYPPTDIVLSLVNYNCVFCGIQPNKYEKFYETSIISDLYDNYKIRNIFSKYIFIANTQKPFILPTWGSFVSYAQN